MNMLIGTVAAIIAFFVGVLAGALWLHSRDERALLDARIARDMADRDRDAAQRSASRWQEQATQRQTIADLDLSLGLDAATATIAELREDLAAQAQERDALTLQLRERAAAPSQQYAVKPPTRPKQRKSPYTVTSGQSDMAKDMDGGSSR